MKIKTLLIAAIACVALVCTGCSKNDSVVTYDWYQVFYGTDSEQRDGICGISSIDGTEADVLDFVNAINACKSKTYSNDAQIINALSDVINQWNGQGKVNARVVLRNYESSSMTPPSETTNPDKFPKILKTWNVTK